MFDTGTTTPHVSSGDCQPNRRTPSTALVVEDHSDFLELLSFVLNSLGYTVLEAKNGKDALRIAGTGKIDLLVTDLGLPEMDGLELVQLVRAFNPDHTNLKIVMLTAYDVVEYESEGLEAGCDAVLPKPIDIEKFARVVKLLQEDLPSSSSLARPPGPPHHDSSAGRHTNATMY